MGRSSHRHTGTKHTGTAFVHKRHHHENKADISLERNIEAVRRGNIATVDIVEKPLPEIKQLTSDEISAAIREITGQFEDTFQDVWVEVVEKGLNDLESIRQIAKELSRKAGSQTIGDRYKTVEFEKPLTGKDSEPSDTTLLDITPSVDDRSELEIDGDIEGGTQYTASSTGKINTQGFVRLDKETYLAIKKLYPHDPLNHAIRKLASLPPPSRMKLGWHKWEDAIIRERYPWGGARAVALDVHRQEHAIESRAKILGVKVGTLNGYKPCPDWFNVPEVAEKIGRNYAFTTRLINEGYIESIRIPKYHQGHDGIFVTPESIANYENRKEIIKKERNAKLQIKRNEKLRETWLQKREKAVALSESKKQVISKLAQERRQVIEDMKAAKEAELNEIVKEKRLAIDAIKDTREDNYKRYKTSLNRLITEKKLALSEYKQSRKLILAEFRQKRQAELDGFIEKYQNRLAEFRQNQVDRQALTKWAAELKEERTLLTHIAENWQIKRWNEIRCTIADLESGKWLVERSDTKNHLCYIKGGMVVHACRPERGIPVETFKMFKYDPFTWNPPTCKTCLQIMEKKEK